MLTVHHLENSRSIRILWMLEELGVPYELKLYARDRQTNLAPNEYRKLHPVGKAPILTDGDLVLAETGAIVEYLLDTHPDSGLRPPVGSQERQPYHYWLHAAEGSLMPLLILTLFLTRMESQPPFPIRSVVKMVTGQVRKLYLTPSLTSLLDHIEHELSRSTWFAGETLTAADIMMGFPMEAAAARGGLGAAHPHALAWIERMRARPAYQAAVEKGGRLDILG